MIAPPSSSSRRLACPVAYIIVIFFVSFSIGRNSVALVVLAKEADQRQPGLRAHYKIRISSLPTELTPAQAQKALASMRVEAIVNIPASFDDDTTAGHALVSRLQSTTSTPTKPPTPVPSRLARLIL